MSKLDELIEELCPDGVEYRHMWELTTWDKRFNSVDRKKQAKIINYPYLLANDLFSLQQDKGDVFLLSTGEQTGWTTEELAGDNLCEGEVVTIPWGKSRKVVDVMKYYNGKFVTADNRIATSNNTSILLNKFLYYWMQSQGDVIDSFYRGSGLKHPSMKNVLDMEIPVPPLEVQREIIRILDNFTEHTEELTEELTKELTARKQQYEYYRNVLLSFDSKIKNTNAFKWMSLKNVCKRHSSGATPQKGNSDYYIGGNIPWLRTQDVKFNEIYDVNTYITDLAVKQTAAKWIPENCVIVAISGASAGRCAINKIPLTTNQHCLNMEINSDIALYKYVFYCVCNQYDELVARKEGARGDLNASRILSMEIPIPSMNEQQRIVSILDQFDALCNDLISDIPAEIEERQKQYEYYRDKLLTFKEKKTA